VDGVSDAPPPVHGLEAQVMEVVWSRGWATVRDVMTAINERSARARAYTTFMTVLVRLHRKGLVERRREAGADHYSATISREDYARSRAMADVQDVIAQHGDLALSAFARRVARLDPERRATLERLERPSSD
jgi:predicted transcriptional regulator